MDESPPSAPVRGGFVAILLRLEGIALFGCAIALYADAGYGFLAFVLLFLVPDLSALGYLAGRRIGAISYDIVHFEGLPLVLGTVALLADWSVGIQVALIWLAHIGIDRAIGYGLKYETDFKHTHIQRV